MVLDRQVEGRIATLKTLSLSTNLQAQKGDLFTGLAKGAADIFPGSAITVRDADGQQFVNIRQRLFVLVLVSALPLIAATVFLIFQLSSSQRESQRAAILAGTRILSAGVDSEIETYAALGRALSSSQALRRGDLQGFYDEALGALSSWPDTWIALADSHDRQLINTTQPFGSTLQPVTILEPYRQALTTKQLVVSNVYKGQTSKRNVVALYQPVLLNGEAVYVIAVAIDPVIFARLLGKQELPAGWISGVVDKQGNFVAHTLPNREVGAPASEAWQKAAQSGFEGQIENTSLDGDKLYSAIVPSRYGWSVSIAARADAILAPLQFSLKLIALIALALLALSAALAWLFGRQIVAPLKIVEAAASGMLRGEKPPVALTGIKEADQALLAFEKAGAILVAQEEQLRLATEAAEIGLWDVDLIHDTLYWPPRVKAMFGISPDVPVTMTDFYNGLHPQDRDAVTTAFATALDPEKRSVYDVEYRTVGKEDGVIRWVAAKGRGIFAEDRCVRVIGTAIDITARKRYEERLKLLVDELNHRVKNTLATVQSMAAQSLRHAPTAEEGRKAFESRLIALSKAHDVLTREQWEAADLEDIVAQTLAAHRGPGGVERIVASGPSLRLQPRVALAISMAFHELATNAVKHGALSNPVGRVFIGWRLDPHGIFTLKWQERDGPVVQPPSKRGFGSRLVEQGLAQGLGGQVTLQFLTEGVLCIITAPLSEVRAGTPGDGIV